MEKVKCPTQQHRALKVALALLLCIACVPAQALIGVQEAWAASTVKARGTALYYQQTGQDGYTLVYQKGETPDEGYGTLVKKVSVARYVDSPSSTAIGDEALNKEVSRIVIKNIPEYADVSFSNYNYNVGYTGTLAGFFQDMPRVREVEIADVNSPNPQKYHQNGTMYSREYFFQYAFRNCTSLERFRWSINLDSNKGWGTYTQNFEHMFEGCTSLKSVEIGGTIGAASSNFDSMFAGCTKLSSCALPNTSVSSAKSMFAGCVALEQVQVNSKSSYQSNVQAQLPTPDPQIFPGATGKWKVKTDSGKTWWIPEIEGSAKLPIEGTRVLDIPDAPYTGSPITPIPIIEYGDSKLVLNTDFTVAYRDNTEPGTAVIVVTGCGDYTGSIEITFTITPSSGPGSGTVDPEPSKPGDNTGDDNLPKPGGNNGNDADAKPGTDTDGNSGTQSGTSSATKPGSSNGGSGSSKPGGSGVTTAPPLSGITVGGAGAGGSSLPTATAGTQPPVSIVVGGKKLVEGVDFTVRRVGGDKVGEAYLVLTGTGLSKWTRTVKYIVLPAGTTVSKTALGKKSTKLAWKKQASQTDGYQVRYSAKKSMRGAKTKTVKGAKKTSAKLPRVKTGKSLYVQVRTYKKAGGKTYYSPWSAKTRVSNPPATSVSKLKRAKRGFTVKWKKQPKKWTTGYQVRYSLKKSMKGAKKLTVKGAKKTSAKVSKLKGGKKYYVQVRSYKKVGKKAYYSPWSKAKAVKTKK